MKGKNIISKCKLLILSAVLLMGLAFGVFNMDKMEVLAEDSYTVTFDYNADTLSDNMPYDNNGVMRASVTTRTESVSSGYLSNVSQYNPSNLFNSYYTYSWTYNGQVVDIASIEIVKDTTFVLKWTPVKYYVRFCFANDTIKSMVTNLVESIEFTVESPRIELYEPEVPNYHFEGWYNGSTHYDMLYLPAGSTGDKNFTARLTPTEYTINYNTSAKNQDNPKHYNVTDGQIVLAEPSQEGQIFKGWYSDDNYTTQITTIDCSVGGNINIYPLWELEVYTVTYILPDGYTRKVEVEYGKKADLPQIDKNIFEIIVTDVSRNNITEDTTIRIKVVNIWYVYVLAIAVIVGIIVAIFVVRKRRENTHDNLRQKYQSGAIARPRATVSIIEKRSVTSSSKSSSYSRTTSPRTTSVSTKSTIGTSSKSKTGSSVKSTTQATTKSTTTNSTTNKSVSSKVVGSKTSATSMADKLGSSDKSSKTNTKNKN